MQNSTKIYVTQGTVEKAPFFISLWREQELFKKQGEACSHLYELFFVMFNAAIILDIFQVKGRGFRVL